ncbi:mast cell protease 1-like [Candoia aspera]|uniref:mast cell protease 1-like n=1 Tax=Candoia aspera TaxID=51853 RepID=UPI002FD7D1D0
MEIFLQLLLFLMVFSLAHPGPLKSRIIGGHEAAPHSRPYMAALKSQDDFTCGGFLVAPQWVMSAAHCMDEVTVVLGAHDLHAVEESQQVLGVESYHMHPAYNPITVTHDILLLKLIHPAKLNKYVQVIPLPRSNSDLPDGTLCTTSGWGMIDRLVRSYKLFETNITIYNRRKCAKLYPELDDAMICAGSFNQLRDTSQGDSGGPMVCNGIVHGIVSFGNSFPPGVYSRIADFLPWIKHIMGSEV